MNELRQIANPFPGLRPFETDEYRLFFGREGQSDELLARLGRKRFLAVVGTSGSGKSSLVRAGLLPALRGGLMEEAGSGWRIAIMRPGGDPIGNLARTLAEKGMLDEAAGGLQGAEAEAVIEATLRGVSLGLIEAVRQAHLSKRENVLVVVDQFEELFRFRATRPAATTADDSSAFVKLLLEASAQREVPIYVVLTMRSDFLGDCAQFWGLPEAINEGQYLIPRMLRDERRKAIMGPIGVARGKVTEPLVNRLLNDVGDNPDQLPILQHALMRTWDEWKEKKTEHSAKHVGKAIDICCYENIGGMADALSRHADEAYEALPGKLQPLAEKIFKCLTEKGLDNREVRRPMLLGDICEVVTASQEEVKQVIDVFRAEGRSFLMPPPPTPLEADTLIDISHESLIRGWDKLKAWVDEEAESARIYKRLADTALLKEQDWEEFYRGAALQMALDWQLDNAPNKAWAQRYHPEYEKAIAFLDASLKSSQEREQAEKDRLENELKQARELAEAQANAVKVQAEAANRRKRYLVGLVFLTAVTIASSVLAVTLQQRALKKETALLAAQTSLTDDALAAAESIKRERLKAEDAAESAEKERLKADSARLEAERLKGEADELRNKAVAQAVELEKSLKDVEKARQDAIKAQKAAEHERDEAGRLRIVQEEQATLYGHFKTAFDNLAEGNRALAASSLEKALEYYTGKNDTLNAISTRINIGDVYRSSESNADKKNALDNYNQAIKLIGTSNDKLLVSALVKAARVWIDAPEDNKKSMPDLKEVSAEYLEEAAAVYQRLGQEDEEAESWVTVGKIFSSNDDEKASRAFQNAVDVYSMPFDGGKIGEINESIGEHYEEILSMESEDDSDDEPTAGQGQSADVREDKLRETAAHYFRKASVAHRENGEIERAGQLANKAGEALSSAKSRQLKDKAVENYTLAAEQYREAGNKEDQTSALVSAGEVYREAENKELWPLADRYYELALKVYRDDENKKQEAVTLDGIGELYGSSTDHEQKRKGVAYYKRAAEIYRETQDRSSQVSALLSAARILDVIRNEASQREATELREQALKVYRDEGNRVEEARTLTRIGRDYGLSNDPEQKRKGITYYKRAVDIYRETQNSSPQVSALLSAARILDDIEDEASLREAAELREQALSVYANNVPLQISTLIQIGRSLSPAGEEGQLTKTEEYFRKAVELAERNGGRQTAASAHMEIGTAYTTLRRPPSAQSSFKRALALYEEGNDKFGQAMALYRLASSRPLSKQESQEFAERSLALFAQVLPGIEASGDKKSLADGFSALGSLYRQKREYELAMANFIKALKLYQSLPDQAARAANIRNLIKTTGVLMVKKE